MPIDVWRILLQPPVALHVDDPAQHLPVIGPPSAVRCGKEGLQLLHLPIAWPDPIAHTTPTQRHSEADLYRLSKPLCGF